MNSALATAEQSHKEKVMNSIVNRAFNGFLIASVLMVAGLNPLHAAEQPLHDRMFHHRAIEAAVWAMPLMNFKFYRDAIAGPEPGIFDGSFELNDIELVK
jgi:hypothetical protein